VLLLSVLALCLYDDETCGISCALQCRPLPAPAAKEEIASPQTDYTAELTRYSSSAESPNKADLTPRGRSDPPKTSVKSPVETVVGLTSVLGLFGARKPASDSYVPSLLGVGRFDGSSKVCGDPTCLECALRVVPVCLRDARIPASYQ
jgi:hypothetical protein